MKKIMIIISAMALMSACGGNRIGEETLAIDSTQTAKSEIPVEVTYEEQDGMLTTMGKVVTAHYADLSFETALPIERVLVRNGQHVKKGQTIAVLDAFKLRNAIEQQEQAIEKAKLEIEQANLKMQDVIIAQGYDPDKAASVPENVKHNADVKSGYAMSKSQLAAARTQLAAAQHELRSCTLTAPFDGVVANLNIQAHQLAQPGQVVCRVMNNKEMEVEFHVMEAELPLFKMGTEVTIIPLVDKTSRHQAIVNEINPMVDAQGTITIRARLTSAIDLFDGMNVEVAVKK